MSSHASWTIEEDLLLREGVLRCGMHWDEVAAYLDQKRSAEACERRWAMTMHNIVKGAWTPEEDNLLCRLVGLFGQKSWAEVARGFPGRTGKQCREVSLSFVVFADSHSGRSSRRDGSATTKKAETTAECGPTKKTRCFSMHARRLEIDGR